MQTFTIGNKAGESSGSYMLYEDEVYIVPVSTYLKQSKYDFLNKAGVAAIFGPGTRIPFSAIKMLEILNAAE